MCGIIGIQGVEPVAEALYHGMLQLQHRGQDASGVFLSDPAISDPMLRKRSGWVFQLFQEEPALQKARWGLGHIRYATSGKGQIRDAQPLTIKKQNHTLAIVHNGNLVNYTILRDELEREGAVFQTTCDSESILHLLSQNLSLDKPFFETLCQAVSKVYERVSGSYSIIGMVTGYGMFAFRDPRGIRPLLLGKGNQLFAIASETVALSNIGCKGIQDIMPGEVVWLDPNGNLHQRRLVCLKKHSHCAFEFNYFAKTPSVMEGKEIYAIRSELGRLLAEKILTLNLPPIDVVVPIPETGNPAGIALAQRLKVPFAEGFIRNQHSGRTFIIADSDKRKAASIQKLVPIRSVFEGKTVLLVDDSIIRGTVSKSTISLARNPGAKKILFASTFPPVLFPCIYGIDFPCKEQLIASSKSLIEITQELGADAVIYNDLETLKRAIGLDDLCLACVTGSYPTSTEGMERLQQLREQDLYPVGSL
jgi:amidophosphoribosyltransferase